MLSWAQEPRARSPQKTLLREHGRAGGQPNYLDGLAVRTHDHMPQVPFSWAKPKFLSVEPLLGPLPDLNLDGIDWVIGGGLSGPRSRRMQQSWVCSILSASHPLQ